MLKLEDLEELLSKENFGTYKPIERDAMLQTHLTVLLAKEISLLREEVCSLKELLNSKSEPVKEPGKPGRKKLETNKEE